MSIFSDRLIITRKQHGISQKCLAETLEITPTRLNFWEKGKREPDISMIFKLADTLKVSADYLIGLVDNPNERYNPSGKKADTLAADEEQLLDNYNKLNPTGKDKVQDYTEDLTDNEKYTAPESELARKLNA